MHHHCTNQVRRRKKVEDESVPRIESAAVDVELVREDQVILLSIKARSGHCIFGCILIDEGWHLESVGKEDEHPTGLVEDGCLQGRGLTGRIDADVAINFEILGIIPQKRQVKNK
jgi:hypothetical protein